MYYVVRNNDYLMHHGVPNQQWGVKNGPPYPLSRRYITEDGNLTEEGLRRKERDKLDKVTESTVNKWVREDISLIKSATDNASKLVNVAKELEKNTRKKKKTTEDIAKIPDQELRNRINRMNMEKQYKDLVGNQYEMSRGRKIAKAILETTGSALAITSSSLGIALAVKQLKS